MTLSHDRLRIGKSSFSVLPVPVTDLSMLAKSRFQPLGLRLDIGNVDLRLISSVLIRSSLAIFQRFAELSDAVSLFCGFLSRQDTFAGLRDLVGRDAG